MNIKILTHEFQGPFPLKTEIPFKQTPPLETINSDIANCPGVFVILTEGVGDDEWKIIDVDTSIDIHKSLNNHSREKCWEKHKNKNIYVAFMCLLGNQAQSRIEKEVRKECNPPCI